MEYDNLEQAEEHAMRNEAEYELQRRQEQWIMIAGGLSVLFAAVAGILLAPKLLMTPDMGVIVILALAAAIIGGFVSLPGCVAGGIVLGVVQNLIGLYVSSRAISLAPFLVIMIVLLLRPQGLFAGKAAAKKV